MRMRKKKHAAERLDACGEIVVREPSELFENGISYELEIGCGKGGFITELAAQNPDRNYAAMEKVTDVIMFAAEKAKAAEQTNIKFINGDAKNVTEYFGEGQVSRIYLNFSDPWPKKGYFKRRLTYGEFLDSYKKILCPGGAVFMKTDNRILFEFSLESFAANGFEVKNVTFDLHNSEFNEGNIMTEYEKNFSEQGIPICRLEAYKL
nr:tRNA (guanosine(46)-N7)-methyltransferase TrmB [Clostridia bacterium]